jgi:hypothetical protein
LRIGLREVIKEGRKQFFFEKKNQKTFTRLNTHCGGEGASQTDKSFLVLFFKKELLPSFFLAFLCAAPTLADPPAKVQQVSKAHAEALLGQPVSDGKGNVVGHVMDVDDTGKPKAAVIDFAGFFGFGNRQIAVDWQALGFSPANGRIDISILLDADKLKSMPVYQPEATSVPVVTQAATKPH